MVNRLFISNNRQITRYDYTFRLCIVYSITIIWMPRQHVSFTQNRLMLSITGTKHGKPLMFFAFEWARICFQKYEHCVAGIDCFVKTCLFHLLLLADLSKTENSYFFLDLVQTLVNTCITFWRFLSNYSSPCTLFVC